MSKRVIAFDLETIADPSAYCDLPPVEPSSNLKDPLKIAEDIRKKEAKQFEELSLNPWTNIICAFGWSTGVQSGHLILHGADIDCRKALMGEIWKGLGGFELFITFNGIAFDVPTLKAQSLMLRVQPTVALATSKYTAGNHLDLRVAFAGTDKFARGTMDFFARRILGGGKQVGIDGSCVQDLWDSGRVREIGEYAEHDAKLVFEMYQAAVECNFFGMGG